jgi:GNAT superfamily N-acetyltransferase
MNITIRPARAADFDAWKPLWQAYLTFYESELTDEMSALTWQRLLDDEPAMFCLIAADDGDKPVGFAHCIVHPSTWTKGPYCYLEDLFVDPALRGGGAARKLISEIYTRAEAHGWERVYWVTQEFNHVARILYDKVATKEDFVQYAR